MVHAAILFTQSNFLFSSSRAFLSPLLRPPQTFISHLFVVSTHWFANVEKIFHEMNVSQTGCHCIHSQTKPSQFYTFTLKFTFIFVVSLVGGQLEAWYSMFYPTNLLIDKNDCHSIANKFLLVVGVVQFTCVIQSIDILESWTTSILTLVSRVDWNRQMALTTFSHLFSV